MRGGAVGIAAVLTLTVTAAPARADVQPNDVTPDGSATLMSVSTRPGPAVGVGRQVLVAWTVTVGEGGQGGPVRLRVGGGLDVVGDPVPLPAQPGTYKFPAPHVDGTWFPLGIDQTIGGHAIVHRSACDPTFGPSLDPCETDQLDVYAGDPPPGAKGSPAVDRGALLTIAPVTEPDTDGDLRGDLTEDRTDLQVKTTSTASPGRLGVTATITNAGPLQADHPELDLSPLTGATARWTGCRNTPWLGSAVCTLDAIPAGASRTVTLALDPSAAGRFAVAVKAEGPDLAPADNSAPITAADPAVRLTAAKAPHGIALTLASASAGRVHVKLRAGGRVTTRTVYLLAAHPTTVTIHPVGRARRALQRAGSASILVTRISGGSASAAAKLKL